jgi:hypothetical protein
MMRFVAGVCRYAVKYNEQLLLTLEEDEFSCKQRLAYKLEQVSICPPPILLFSSLTFKMPTKNKFKKSFSAYYFLKVFLHHFSKVKSQKEVKKQ